MQKHDTFNKSTAFDDNVIFYRILNIFFWHYVLFIHSFRL